MTSSVARPLTPPRLLPLYLELGKARLIGMVVITTAVGYIVAPRVNFDLPLFFWTLLGTALAGLGANAFNQVLEVERDRRMERTCHRPLPAEHLSIAHGIGFATLTGLLGAVLLWTKVNPLTGILGFLNLLIYVLIYTPMKPRSTLNTLVGAVCGAIPPMMGWSAATGLLGYGAWLLGGILFIWQIPHFLALAWLYRVDYARGGFKMLPIQDPQGTLTCQMILLYSLALFPLGLAITLQGIAGWYFGIGSMVLGLAFFYQGYQLHLRRDQHHARRLFLASIIYLPILMLLMVADCRGGGTIHLPPQSLPAVAQR